MRHFGNDSIPTPQKKRHGAFTLAELLVALTILGVIATFTIPKLLVGSTNAKYRSMTKEVISSISQAYQKLCNDTQCSSTTNANAVIPYLNKVSDASQNDDPPTGGGIHSCIGSCINLHNGGVLESYGESFAGISANNAVRFNFDPDGNPNNNNSIFIILYFTGRLTTSGSLQTVLNSSYGTLSPNQFRDPDWFSWN